MTLNPFSICRAEAPGAKIRVVESTDAVSTLIFGLPAHIRALPLQDLDHVGGDGVLKCLWEVG